MKTFRLLYHLARADFLERVRRYSFLVTLAAAIYLGWAANAGYIQLNLDKYRGIYNSAWIGILMTLSTTLFVSLVGFYVVKNTIDRDRQTRVGQILAATPLSKFQYCLGKWLSNFAVLSIIVFILAAAGVIMQLLRGGESHFEWWPLVSPFLLIALPAMAVIAALAVLFESISLLRGGFGNVAYIFLWAFMIVFPVEAKKQNLDISGIGFVQKDMRAAVRAEFPDYNGNFSLNAGPRPRGASLTFVWKGIDWNPKKIAARLFWFFAAVLLVLLAALFFDRFDSMAGRQTRAAPTHVSATLGSPSAGSKPAPIHLTPLPAGREYRFSFTSILWAELKLMVKGLGWWWRAVAGGLTLAGLLAPTTAVREFILPFSWLWPVLLWSPMGTREARNQTSQMAGVVVAVLTGAGAGLRFVFSGEWPGVFAWVSGAVFIPSLALALGSWSGTSKLFEAVYTAIWYIGPINKIPALDYIGATRESITSGMPAVFLLVSAILLGLAVIGRKRQLQV
ncbi:MAG: ABC transporter permease [candidate division Zixibacteria bacterium]|nr:ABC transporter permease [candidate division Zixibacteria bacterium]